MKTWLGAEGGNAVTFISVVLGALLMIRALRIDAEVLVATVYLAGVYALWRANSALLRAVAHGAALTGGAQPDHAPPI
ncbi:MAG TPA: hypothetical protein VFM55_06395 [Micromonosporaceae bacterium]|nr:hypothetical protein [Micromonosporaceae bacterium]